MARRHKQYKAYSPATVNPIEKAEREFMTSVDALLTDLAYTLADMPAHKTLPKNLQHLVGQVAKGYVTMADAARAYNRRS